MSDFNEVTHSRVPLVVVVAVTVAVLRACAEGPGRVAAVPLFGADGAPANRDPIARLSRPIEHGMESFVPVAGSGTTVGPANLCLNFTVPVTVSVSAVAASTASYREQSLELLSRLGHARHRSNRLSGS
jgi:hypothetical protein